MSEKEIRALIEKALAGPAEASLNPESPNNLISISQGNIKGSPKRCYGMVAVNDGQITVDIPEGCIKYPSISPGQGVRIFVNGAEIRDAAVLTEDSRVEVDLNDEQPKSEFEITLSHDKSEAQIKVLSRPGKKYRLEDQKASLHLVLHKKLVAEVLPAAISIDKVRERMNSLGIVVGVDLPALKQALLSPTGEPIVIARGQPPVPSEDAYIEYLFDMQERTPKTVTADERIDYLDKGEFQAVEIGTVLAVKHPPRPGKNGLAVTGESIPTPEPKDTDISVGEGTCLVHQGQKAVATAAGRPVLVGKKRTLKVLPLLTISGNVDINTGHIEFKGDVLIKGSVMEGLTVRASGRVVVFEHVYAGHILAGGDVTIGQNLVGGSITSGGEVAFLSRILPTVSQLRGMINHLNNAVKQLKSNQTFCTDDLNIKGDGNLIKLLIDVKFQEIPKLVDLLNNCVKSLIYQPDKEILEYIYLLNVKLTGLGPLSITTMEELDEIEQKSAGIVKMARDALVNITNVTIKYAQNALIEATGSVYITGAGSYHTKIYAGKDVSVAGVCRGGEIHADGKIAVSQLGTSTAAVTRVETTVEGRITAERVFPNVYLRVGQQTFKAETNMKNVACYWDDKTGLIVNGFQSI